MAILADLPFIHMQTFAATERIERRLSRLSRQQRSSEHSRRIVDEIASEAVRLRQQLNSYYARERQELFPRVERIFGAQIDEISELSRYQELILSSLDRFIAELNHDDGADIQGYRAGSAYLGHLFGEFLGRYEERCNIERFFYESYSTILYPGGVSTD